MESIVVEVISSKWVRDAGSHFPVYFTLTIGKNVHLYDLCCHITIELEIVINPHSAIWLVIPECTI